MSAARSSLRRMVSPRLWRVVAGDPETQTVWTLWGKAETDDEARRIAESKIPSGCKVVESKAWANDQAQARPE